MSGPTFLTDLPRFVFLTWKGCVALRLSAHEPVGPAALSDLMSTSPLTTRSPV